MQNLGKHSSSDGETKIEQQIASEGLPLSQTDVGIFVEDEQSNERIESKKTSEFMKYLDYRNIQDFASANKTIIIFRPINEQTAEKFDKGYLGKGLNVKGKSAEYGPIKGEIPYDARLSKAARFGASIDRIKKFQQYNDDAIDKSEKPYKEFIEKKKIFENQINNNVEATEDRLKLVRSIQADIEKINSQSLAKKTTKKTDQEELVYYFKKSINQDNGSIDQILCDSEGKAQYAVKRGDEFYFFIEAAISAESKDQPNGYEPHEVELLAYTLFELDKANNEIKEKTSPLTADYDELVSAPLKMFPFNNNEMMATLVSRSLYRTLLDNIDKKEKIDPKMLIAELVYQHEKLLKNSHRYTREIKEMPSMGIVNDTQLAIKTYLKALTGGNVNHSAEVYSPAPQPFADGEVHLAFEPLGALMGMADKKQELDIKTRLPAAKSLTSEAEICDFINESREKGFPLDVHPKWGWIKNKDGKLEIPPYNERFGIDKWEEVQEGLVALCEDYNNYLLERDELLDLYNIISSDENIIFLKGVEESWLKQKEGNEISCAQVLKNSLNDINEPICQNKGALVTLTELDDKKFEEVFSRINDEADAKSKLNLEEDIIGLKLKIKKLELEPEIIYSKGFASGREHRVLPGEQKIQEEIAKLVRAKDKLDTDKTIVDLNKSLDKKLSEYDKKYKRDPLIIEMEKEIIQQQVFMIENSDNNTDTEKISSTTNLRHEL